MNGVFVSKEQQNELSNAQKWWVSIATGLLFALISSPFMYQVTNSIFGKTTTQGGPTLWGLILHTIVFTLLVRLLML